MAEFDHVHQSELEAIKLYGDLKECLFPRSSAGGNRKPASPGPTENLELFGKAMGIIANLGVSR